MTSKFLSGGISARLEDRPKMLSVQTWNNVSLLPKSVRVSKPNEALTDNPGESAAVFGIFMPSVFRFDKNRLSLYTRTHDICMYDLNIASDRVQVHLKDNHLNQILWSWWNPQSIEDTLCASCWSLSLKSRVISKVWSCAASTLIQTWSLKLQTSKPSVSSLQKNETWVRLDIPFLKMCKKGSNRTLVFCSNGCFDFTWQETSSWHTYSGTRKSLKYGELSLTKF